MSDESKIKAPAKPKAAAKPKVVEPKKEKAKAVASARPEAPEAPKAASETPEPKGDRKDAKPKKEKKEKKDKKAKKKEKRKKEAVIIRFEDAQLPQIDAKAEALGLSRAAWVRMVVAQALGKG